MPPPRVAEKGAAARGAVAVAARAAEADRRAKGQLQPMPQHRAHSSRKTTTMVRGAVKEIAARATVVAVIGAVADTANRVEATKLKRLKQNRVQCVAY